MSYVIVKSINMRDINNIKIIGADNNVYPRYDYESYYRTDEKGAAISKFIHDLDGGSIQPMLNASNAKYIYALEKTKEELTQYSDLEYGLWSLNILSEDFKIVVKTYLKYLKEKDESSKYAVKLQHLGDAYLMKILKDSIKYTRYPIKFYSKKHAFVLANKLKHHGAIMEAV